MLKKYTTAIAVLITGAVFLISGCASPVDPVSWKAPANPGYTGPFAVNEKLTDVEKISIGDNKGPEDVALDDLGRIYVSTHEGHIVRLQPDGSAPENWVQTGGRPLGIDFDKNGNLIVADAYEGLLSISPEGAITVLTTSADDIPILYADDVDIAADGKIYFSDASTKFGAKEWGGTLEASKLDIMEHGAYGRLLVYDPATGKTIKLMDGLNFANGVAVSPSQDYVLVNETGSYRVIRYWIAGEKKGTHEPLIEELPSFPDNISTGLEGRFWVGLVAPRNKIVDTFSDNPWIRKLISYLPKFMHPKAKEYGHIIAIDEEGKVLDDLQDPSGDYPMVTAITETEEYLYLGSLVSPVLGRLPQAK
jgi:sugar lactone lactonase YvrE